MNWKIIDSLLFIIIILALTSLMFSTTIGRVPEDEPPEFAETDTYAVELSRAFLSGTVPRANYTDFGGTETVYTGWSMKQLLIEDLRIRTWLGPYRAPANNAELSNGIESAAAAVISDILGDDQVFSLNVSWSKKGSDGAAVFFNVRDSEFPVQEGSVKLISSSAEVIALHDLASTEVGEFEMKVVLRIYRITSAS